MPAAISIAPPPLVVAAFAQVLELKTESMMVTVPENTQSPPPAMLAVLWVNAQLVNVTIAKLADPTTIPAPLLEPATVVLPFVSSKPSTLVVPAVPLSTLTTLLAFNPSKMHLATMSEHVIVTTLLMQSELLLSLPQEPLNDDPAVAIIVSPTAALSTALARADVETVVTVVSAEMRGGRLPT